MNTRAKFKCDSKTVSTYGHSVKFSPVGQTTPENAKFWQYTPSGQFEMGGLKRETVDRFDVGEEYYLDITHAPKPASEG